MDQYVTKQEFDDFKERDIKPVAREVTELTKDVAMLQGKVTVLDVKVDHLGTRLDKLEGHVESLPTNADVKVIVQEGIDKAFDRYSKKMVLNISVVSAVMGLVCTMISTFMQMYFAR